MSRPRLHDLIYLGLIIFIALVLTRTIWATRSVSDSHDGMYHAVRMAELADMLRQGQFPVRWAGNLDGGYGLPLFNFVYPLPYYAGLPVILAGLSPFWAVKAVTVGAYLLGGIGMYFLLRKQKIIAAVGAILYLTAPYQLLNIFVRGALGETLAIGLIPWVLLTGFHLKDHKLKWFHPVPFALLFLSHNFLSILFIPFYLVLVADKKSWKKIILSGLLSLGLASFYLIPAVLEAKYLSSVAGTDFSFKYSDHFVYPLQLIWSNWGVGFSVAGTGDGMSFQLGIGHLAALVLGLMYFRKSQVRTVILLAVSLFLVLPYSAFVWESIPYLRVVQFPWRLLFLPVTLIPLILAGSGASEAKGLKVWGIVGVTAAALFFAFIFAHPRYPMNLEQTMSQWYANRYRTTTSQPWELRPRWAGDVHSDEFPHVNYFPSWTVRDETGKVITTRPSETGQVTFTPEDGSHTYALRLHSTPVEMFGNAVTILSALVLIGLSFI